MVTDIEVMPNDHIVVCDHKNDRIKLFDSTGDFKGNLSLQSSPWDIAALHDNLVIVTLPGIKQLQRIELFPKLKLLRSMHLNQGCYGIAVEGNEIFITCHDNPGNGQVIVLQKGSSKSFIRRIFDVRPCVPGMNLLNRPSYVAVSAIHKLLFITDTESMTVTIYDFNGTFVDECEYEDPNGICVVICVKTKNLIGTFNAKSRKGRKFYFPQILLPLSISYRKRDNAMFIGCEKEGKLFNCFFE